MDVNKARLLKISIEMDVKCAESKFVMDVERHTFVFGIKNDHSETKLKMTIPRPNSTKMVPIESPPSQLSIGERMGV